MPLCVSQGRTEEDEEPIKQAGSGPGPAMCWPPVGMVTVSGSECALQVSLVLVFTKFNMKKGI